MIERFVHVKMLPAAPEHDVPPMMVHERAYLDCGCQALVGVRLDKGEKAAFFFECPEHDLTEAKWTLQASLAEPTDDPLVVVIDRILNGKPWKGD